LAWVIHCLLAAAQAKILKTYLVKRNTRAIMINVITSLPYLRMRIGIISQPSTSIARLRTSARPEEIVERPLEALVLWLSPVYRWTQCRDVIFLRSLQ
jgi:hypothetical protein